jgi:hypothetical protein
MSASAFELARWFQAERYANRPEDDFVRDEVLEALYQRTECVGHGKDGQMLAKTDQGMCMVEFRNVDGSPLVTFDFVSDSNWTRTSFWMNASSVDDLVNHLEQFEPVGDFDEMFVQGSSYPVPAAKIVVCDPPEGTCVCGQWPAYEYGKVCPSCRQDVLDRVRAGFPNDQDAESFTDAILSEVIRGHLTVTQGQNGVAALANYGATKG